MHSTEYQSLIRRVFAEGLNQARLDVIRDVFAPNVVDHADQSDASGSAGITQFVLDIRATFPDLEVTVEPTIGDGNQVASRESWRGTHAITGQYVDDTVRHWFVFEDGQVVEEWSAGWEWLNDIEFVSRS